jgi:hypothetical protein
VTVCIATIADHEKSICLVTDTKASFGTFSADGAVRKNVPLIYRHAVLFAGNDASQAGLIISRTKKRLQEHGYENISIDEISQCIFEECQTERDTIAEAEILKPHGYDLATFRTEGAQLCTESVFYDIHSELQKKTLSLDFIVAGFDASGHAHIRFTNCLTPPQDYDSIGFWAIGTGAHAALASLSHAVEYLRLSTYRDSQAVLFHTLSAKFMAESARDVGKDTDAMILLLCTDEVKIRRLNPFGGIDYARKLWEEAGSPRMPPNLRDEMDTILIDNMEQATLPEKLKKLASCSKAARDFLQIRKKHTKTKQLGSQTSEGQQ